MTNFRPGDRVQVLGSSPPHHYATGPVLATRGEKAWVDVPGGPLTFRFDSLRLVPLTVSEAAVAYLLAHDAGWPDLNDARDDLRAALAAEDGAA